MIVPYGYVIHLNPNTIHCDSANSGISLSAFADEPADVVFLRTQDTEGRPLSTFNPYSTLIDRTPMTEMQRMLQDTKAVMLFTKKTENAHTFSGTSIMLPSA